ncbi:MAG: RHS repeat protein [Planctomycetes bacterium]|nr:RHS repeat protein [Planctomycetota bacterium]
MRQLLLRAAALCVAAFSAHAHDVFPAAITLRPGGEDFVYVADQGTCPASITITSTNPSAVKVFSINMTGGAVNSGNGTTATVSNRVDQVFVVRAVAGLTIPAASTLQVCWIGADFPGGFCNENNCAPFVPHLVPVTVEPLPANAGANLSAALAGDPIETNRGEFVAALKADFDLGGVQPLDFRRYYSSRVAIEGNNSSTLGPGWLHNYSWKLESTGNNVEVATDTGRVLRFERGFQATDWSLAVVDDIPYQLIENVSVFTLANPLDGLRRTFDSNGRLTSVSDGRGNAHTLTYVGGLLTNISDGLGRTLTFTHTSGRLTGLSDGTRTVNFGYDGNSRLTSSTDAAGETTTYTYVASPPSSPLLASITLPEGNTPYVQTYDANSRVATQTDAFSEVTSFAYDTASGETTLTDALGRVQVHDYDSDGDLVSWEDESGAAATLQNDATGRRTAITDRLGRTNSWTIHAASGRIARKTEADGGQTTFTYTPRNSGGFTFYDVTAITYADGNDESFSYDANGNRTGWTDRGGNTWTYTFNARGQVLTETSPLTAVRAYAYNADATLASIDDPALGLATFSYDALRRVSEITFADTTLRAYSYDALDRLTSVTDEESAVTTFGYDGNGNVTSITAPSNQAWTLSYDALDRLTSVEDPLGNTASASYDEVGRVAGLVDATGKGVTLGYDVRGRLESAAFSSGPAWSNAHDAEGAPGSSTTPRGDATAYVTDVLGRVTRATSPTGAVSRRTFDLFGRLKTSVDAEGRTTSFNYDPLGRVASFALPFSGATASFTRNALGQTLSAALPGGALWASAYDTAGRLESTTDPLGRVASFDHDARGRVSQVTFPGGLGSVAYEFDGASRLTRRLYSDGLDIDYTYDAHGRITSTEGVTFGYDAAGRMTSSNGLAIGRDAAGRVSSVQYGPGMTVQYAYDARGLGVSLTDWSSGVTQFTHDANGNRTLIERPSGVDTTRSFGPDDKLTRILERDATPTRLADTQLSYNSLGLIEVATRMMPLEATPLDSDLSFGHDAAQQVAGWNFDALGRTLGDGHDFTADYDLGSRVTTLTEGGESYDLRYDGFDNLTGWTVAGDVYELTRNYAFAGAPPAQLSINGVMRYSYIADFDGALFSTYDHVAQEVSFHHFDERGSTLFSTDASGAISERFAYDPTGALLDRVGGDDNPFRHRGRDWTISLGSGRLQYEDKHFFDTCTLRSLVRSSPTLLAMYALWSGSWFSGEPLVGGLGGESTRLVDDLWLGEKASLSAKLDPKFRLEARYEYDYEASAGAPTPAPAGVDVPSAAAALVGPGDATLVAADLALATLGPVVAENAANYRETVIKFRSARALASYFEPRSASARFRQLVVDELALRTALSLGLSDSFGVFNALFLMRGPSEVRGALQDPQSLAFRRNGGPSALLGIPYLRGLFAGHAANRPLQLLLPAHLESEE